MAKFAEHLPLYRQSEIYARQGVELSRNTMGRWVDIMGEQLPPLYDELNRYVLMPGKVHADDTPVNVLEQWNALNECTAAMAGWRSTITCVKTPSGWLRWGGVTTCSSALMVVATVRQ